MLLHLLHPWEKPFLLVYQFVTFSVTYRMYCNAQTNTRHRNRLRPRMEAFSRGELGTYPKPNYCSAAKGNPCVIF